ncbi:hypothetical protein [Thermoactinospora rubra]|uniref:hypothetical protein n=1 Tax=Thermoactinospora rubra TaxID=1088767 RepID=UPI000A1061D5|nr:hypothetical protein [Thermoactinospora rubra]
MKRILAGVAVMVAALLTAGPARAAAPADPVEALAKIQTAGKGVSFTERVTYVEGKTRDVQLRREGRLAFRKGGIAASDITAKLNIKASDLPEDATELGKTMATPERTIYVGSTAYISGGMTSTVLPHDKSWVKIADRPAGGILGQFAQPINVAEPATLKALLKIGTKTASGYQGEITMGQLRKASAWTRASFPGKPDREQLQEILTWRLTLDSRGLPARLVTQVVDTYLGRTTIYDTRYTGWGATVKITPPPADQAITIEELRDIADGIPPVPFPGHVSVGS